MGCNSSSFPPIFLFLLIPFLLFSFVYPEGGQRYITPRALGNHTVPLSPGTGYTNQGCNVLHSCVNRSTPPQAQPSSPLPPQPQPSIPPPSPVPTNNTPPPQAQPSSPPPPQPQPSIPPPPPQPPSPVPTNNTLPPQTQPSTPPPAHPDTKVVPGRIWTTTSVTKINTTEGWAMLPVLVQPNNGPSFVSGLLCNGESSSVDPCQDKIIFGVFIVVVKSSNITTDTGRPIVVWSANRNNPARHVATLTFTASGGLQLEDTHSGIVWSTAPLPQNIAAMDLTPAGNLVLYGNDNNVVWQSSSGTKMNDASGHSRQRLMVIIIVVCCFIFSVTCILLTLSWRRRRNRIHDQQKNREKEEEEEREIGGFNFRNLPGTPRRFTYEELRLATSNFSWKLGEGGFGAVFRGKLEDGMEIAVKILGQKGQGMKEFLAEVDTIGSIHHVNLVRLVGYCVDRVNRLLVYEFLSNGSLEKWIFQDSLDWPKRYKIALDVARGLSYLHEECRKRIIHLDIKPQNILLDERFNAKVADFGLSKLMDKEQSKVVTTLRGTLGYIAPEWLSSIITEKVDVYSFGVVLLEMVSGKRVLDGSRPDGSSNLLEMLKKAVEEDRLLDIVGGDCKGDEAIRMLRIAMWCLQGDHNKRPSMPVVVKVLEKVMDVKADLENNFWIPSMALVMSGDETSSTPSGATPLASSVIYGRPR